MKRFRILRQLSFLSFAALLIITTTLVIACSNWQSTQKLTIKESAPQEEAKKGYELPDINDPVPSPVYPNYITDGNISVRKSVTQLSAKEKTAFVNAVNVIKNTIPLGSKISIYDQLALDHVLVMGCEINFKGSGPAHGANHAHGLPAFLPWHRQFVREFEKALQKVDPSVTVPYWDWTDPKALEIMLQDDFLGPNGRGTFVDIPGAGRFEGGVVKSGPFANWTLNEDIHISPIKFASLGSKLLRFVEVPPLNKYPIPKKEIDQLMKINNYEIFNAILEGDESLEGGKPVKDRRLHSYAHGLIGGALFKDIKAKPLGMLQTKILGTMGSLLSSAYDPIFYLNHANVDRLWAEWQDKGHTGKDFFPAKDKPVGHNLKDPMWPWDGGKSKPGNLGAKDIVSLLNVAPEKIVTPSDVLDFRKLGYTYDTTRLVKSKQTRVSVSRKRI